MRRLHQNGEESQRTSRRGDSVTYITNVTKNSELPSQLATLVCPANISLSEDLCEMMLKVSRRNALAYPAAGGTKNFRATMS